MGSKLREAVKSTVFRSSFLRALVANYRSGAFAPLAILRMVLVRIPTVHRLYMRRYPRSAVFASAFSRSVWGSAESRSGQGSELTATATLRGLLSAIFLNLNVESVLDAPCGDWNWMREVDLTRVTYCGADLVPELIARNNELFGKPGVRFVQADLTEDALPQVDLVICRDCWVHLSYQDIAGMLENFRRSGSRWLLTTNSPDERRNTNQFTGLQWRYLNLSLPPFNFPQPVETFADHDNDPRLQLSLWRISDLPRADV
jgi:hypothetical protein